ncbi:MAG: PHP domain-containing protein [Spirochaetales bacterium]|jgi:predicted metal-dependent phosphoesterase TrpH|nr:PHP domain-containing protein [Spirochaetales bacterium]
MVDLHTHSTQSDGSLTPARLISAAKETGLIAVALTDHDTLSGLPEAEKAAEEAGIRFIPGIELNITYSSGEFHMLGLGIRQWQGSSLEQTLSCLQQDRTRRNHAILDAMRKDGINAEYSELQALAGGKIIGRPHVARLLVVKKIVKNTSQAFQRYLKKGMPWYVPRKGISVEEAAGLIHAAGGLAVIAHPLSLYLSWGALARSVKTCRDQGVDGIEAWHSNASPRECTRLEGIARDLGMLVSAGSDFHGQSIPGRRLGCTCEDGRPIEDSFAAPFC